MFPDFAIAESATLILLGLPIGAVGAVVGVGGGFLLVPALLFLFPDADPASVATVSLTAIFFNACSASAGYRRKRLQDFRTAGILIALAVPGAVAGALLNNATGRAAFETVFGAALIAGSVYLVARSALEPRRYAPARRGRPRTVVDSEGVRYDYRVNEPLAAAAAPWAGVAAGFFGIGGGIINVPFMMLALRIPKAVAVPTSQTRPGRRVRDRAHRPLRAGRGRRRGVAGGARHRRRSVRRSASRRAPRAQSRGARRAGRDRTRALRRRRPPAGLQLDLAAYSRRRRRPLPYTPITL